MSLSTLEAEVIAVAKSCRALLLMIDMATFVGDAAGLARDMTTICASMLEDNAGALILAESLPPQSTV